MEINGDVFMSCFNDNKLKSLDIIIMENSKIILDDSCNFSNLEYLNIQGTAKYDMRCKLIETSSYIVGKFAFFPNLKHLQIQGVIYDIDFDNLSKCSNLKAITIRDYNAKAFSLPNIQNIWFNGWCTIDDVDKVAHMIAESYKNLDKITWSSIHYEPFHKELKFRADLYHKNYEI
jgi:hypothetical protein